MCFCFLGVICEVINVCSFFIFSLLSFLCCRCLLFISVLLRFLVNIISFNFLFFLIYLFIRLFLRCLYRLSSSIFLLMWFNLSIYISPFISRILFFFSSIFFFLLLIFLATTLQSKYDVFSIILILSLFVDVIIVGGCVDGGAGVSFCGDR